jgi:hypothetical protein
VRAAATQHEGPGRESSPPGPPAPHNHTAVTAAKAAATDNTILRLSHGCATQQRAHCMQRSRAAAHRLWGPPRLQRRGGELQVHVIGLALVGHQVQLAGQALVGLRGGGGRGR